MLYITSCAALNELAVHNTKLGEGHVVGLALLLVGIEGILVHAIELMWP